MLGFGGPPALPMDPEMAAAWDAYTECALDGDNPVARGLYAPQLYVTPGVGNHCTTMVKYNRTCSQRTILICLAHCRYNWLKSYSPGQIYIMQSEKLFADPTVEMERLTNWLGMRPHYKHEQQQFQIVGSRHMQEFNSQFLKNNIGKKDSVFAKTVDCDKDIINVSACRGDTKWLP
jgi:hypothetical protein